MASVIARVELHSGTAENYVTLHSSMEAEGFSRFVKANDGRWYHLPTGTYVHGDVQSCADGNDRAVRAAGRTGRSSAIFLGDWNEVWNSTGLTQAG